MSEVYQYVLRITSAALICGIVSGLTRNAGVKEFIRLLCGVFMTVTVLGPLASIDIQNITEITVPYIQDRDGFSAEGEALSREALTDIIKTETEAYILDKAEAMGVTLYVKVNIGQDEIPVPESIELHGSVPGPIQNELMKMIETDLGIPKESQRWIG